MRQQPGSYKLSHHASAYDPISGHSSAAHASSLHWTAQSQFACTASFTSPASAAGRPHAAGRLQHQVNSSIAKSSAAGTSNPEPACCSKSHWRQHQAKSLARSQSLPVQANSTGLGLHATSFAQALTHTAGFSTAARYLQLRHQQHPSLHKLPGLVSIPYDCMWQILPICEHTSI